MSLQAKIGRWVIDLICIIGVVAILFPLLWMFGGGFKTDTLLFSNPWALPPSLSFSNFINVWNRCIATNVFNSVFYTVIGTFLTVVLSGFAAYAVVRFKFKFKYFVFLFILSGMMLAPQSSLIPIYKILTYLNLYNTRIGLLIPYIAYRIPFSFFLMWSFMLGLPVEIDEAACIDGSSIFRTFFRIIVPMSKPAIATTAIMAARFIWNDFAFALVFSESDSLRTIPLGLFALRSANNTQWTILLAGLAIASLPMVIAYICLQKYFVNGLNSGAVKG
ncbi:MAG TPA: carbohydrate ABC transporter permease [Caproiciproducens sp.]|nr:carbohydrate ABC transporter permease [Caproiciproducens sp.]